MKRLICLIPFLLLIVSCGTESNPTYTLTTTVSPSEGGTITLSPSDGVYSEGETVTLTGNPNSDGWRFVRWEGDWSSTDNPTTVTVNRDYNIVGVFERRNYPLNIEIIGEGTVEEVVIKSKTNEYPYETVVELTPIPSQGWEFVEWGGDLSGSQIPIQIAVSEEKNVTVTFLVNIFLGENGITIMCPNVPTGTVGLVNEVEYEVVDRELLIQRRDEGIDMDLVCVSNVTDMSEMFRDRTVNGDITGWDVSSVTDMRVMFLFSPFNQPIGDWDVSNVTDMTGMFSFSQFNQPIGDWDVSSVTDMSGMFGDTPFNQPIGDWDVSSVTNIRQMFRNSEFNKPIGNWDVSNVTDMSGMFSFSQFNQPIGDWDVSSVTDMNWMFRDSQFNQAIGDWDVSSVIDMIMMFLSSQFNQSINQWCVENIPTEPLQFSTGSPLTPENKPVWGTCP